MQKAKIVTDPNRMVTDPVLLSSLSKQGIDKDYVEFVQDYGKRIKGKSSPYMKLYRDLKSSKRWAVISQLPMVDAEGNKVEVGWREAGVSYFTEKNNLFRCKVQGTQVEITIRNDQPDGRKAGDKLSLAPQLFLDGVKQSPSLPALLGTDPVNSNYLKNILEWDYGICKRRLRIIEGRLLGSWVFDSKPGGTVRIRYNQSGDYRLKLGQFKVSDDEEVITPEQFDELTKEQGDYPVTIRDTDTFYPDADPETSSVDGQVGHTATEGTTGGTWASVQGGAGNYVDDGTAELIVGYIKAGSNTNKWHRIIRGITLFDTSSLPDGATITDAVLSIYCSSKRDDIGISPTFNVYSSAPASNMALVAGDFDSLGTVAYATAIAYANINAAGYNDWTLNATGIAAIDKAGITKMGHREASKDVANIEPSWNGATISDVRGYSTEQGAGFKPKLVVTYTVPEADRKTWAFHQARQKVRKQTAFYQDLKLGS